MFISMYSLRIACRTLSNTVPTYLEAMQRMVISMEQINSNSDIEAFVEQHTPLTEQSDVPPFEQHHISIKIEQVGACTGGAPKIPTLFTNKLLLLFPDRKPLFWNY